MLKVLAELRGKDPEEYSKLIMSKVRGKLPHRSGRSGSVQFRFSTTAMENRLSKRVTRKRGMGL